MTQYEAVPVILLATVLGGGTFILFQDTRSRRVGRQVNVATAGLARRSAPSARRRGRRPSPTEAGRSTWIYHLLNYDPRASGCGSPGRTMLVGIAAAIAASLLLQTLVSLGLALAGGVSAGLVLTRTLFGWQRDRYADRLLRQLPDMLQIVMSVVRAGLPVSEAFRIVAREMPEPTCSEFALVAEELALGHSADIALLGVHRRTGVSEFAIFSVTLSVQAKSGGGLVETIQNLADTLRERIALSGRATALSGEARLSSQILTAFPFVMAAALSVLHPGFFSPLLGDPRGRMLLAFALLCLVVGNIVMRMMIKKGTAV